MATAVREIGPPLTINISQNANGIERQPEILLPDIEHTIVQDDPRQWSSTQKVWIKFFQTQRSHQRELLQTIILAIISAATLIQALPVNMQIRKASSVRASLRW